MLITPTISNGIFTLGKRYYARPVPGASNLLEVKDDRGHSRFVSCDVGAGRRCAHLKPRLDRLPGESAHDYDRRVWHAAGCWERLPLSRQFPSVSGDMPLPQVPQVGQRVRSYDFDPTVPDGHEREAYVEGVIRGTEGNRYAIEVSRCIFGGETLEAFPSRVFAPINGLQQWGSMYGPLTAGVVPIHEGTLNASH
jgi:hypothetical protein